MKDLATDKHIVLSYNRKKVNTLKVDKINKTLSKMGLRKRAIAWEDGDGLYIEWDSLNSHSEGGRIEVDKTVTEILETNNKSALLNLMVPFYPMPHFEPWKK